MAQVMTRGTVKSRFIIQWAIRSQVPIVEVSFYLVCSSSTRWWLVLLVLIMLKI
uniref:Unclassified n=4 Tax=Fusarium pseudograminearum TaxID=101028 RepID=W1I9E2_FUSPS|nr:unclassified [Fusarium pseudograminearum CS3220]CDL73108.1 unclassified [Fusarium pseudograminearum CS3427]CDL73285.1 unclassified [Fusarium pseudograminearum CS5834]CDX48223.1 unclassified [Fusarium pseudograminearum CS5834]CDX48413.1 unclassified [Fusarium pseudograminearum CS3427]